jgi:hypothetical protein
VLLIYASPKGGKWLALIVKSLVLPQTEADLLLRYQTTWERRLSTEVGVFVDLHPKLIHLA